jgi:hypothetical protein
MAFQNGNANLRTLNVDKIFVRDIFFKDFTNRPISAGQVLFSRGDGGTYFDFPEGPSTYQRGFNVVRAGSNFEFTASNPSTNVLWFQPGPGIEFFSSPSIIPGTDYFWISYNGPEQLQVWPSQSTLQLSNVSSLTSGGKTLMFAGSSNVTITISDNMVYFDTTNSLLFSTISTLTSTLEGVQNEQEILAEQVSTLYEQANLFYVSTSVSSFYSTLVANTLAVDELSTFVYSTFARTGGELDITYPNVHISSLRVDEFNGPIISTFSTLYWSTAVGLNATVSSMRISTIMGGSSLPIITFDAGNRRIGVNLGATQQPRTTLDVDGIVYASNFVTSSDRRLKTNITPLAADFETLPASYRFDWIAGGAHDVGCLADEVEAVAPECVVTDASGYKAVNYAKLVPYCLAAIRALGARVAALERRQGPLT